MMHAWEPGHFAFCTICITLIFTAVLVITAKRPLMSALFLIIELVGLGVLYLMLDAPLVAAMQWLVYAGAIMVLFIFVIMLFKFHEVSPTAPSSSTLLSTRGIIVVLVGGLFLGILFKVLVMDFKVFQASGLAYPPVDQSSASTLQSVAMLLFSKHVFVFEILSVVLLAALVGAILLARRSRSRPV